MFGNIASFTRRLPFIHNGLTWSQVCVFAFDNQHLGDTQTWMNIWRYMLFYRKYNYQLPYIRQTMLYFSTSHGCSSFHVMCLAVVSHGLLCKQRPTLK